MWKQLERKPAPCEIAARLDVEPRHRRGWQSMLFDTISLDATQDSSNHRFDLPCHPHEPSGMSSNRSDAVLQELLGCLNQREAEAIRARFGLDDGAAKSLAEVGRQLGLTRERIRQLEKSALAKMQSAAGCLPMG